MSKLNDNAKIKGHLTVFTRPKGTSNWLKKIDLDNLIVNQGVNLTRNNTFAAQVDRVQWGAVSDNASAPTASDTSLGGNEIRVVFQDGYPDLSVNYQTTIQYFIDATEWDPAGLTSVKKAGLYYRSSGSYLYNAASFNSINVDENTEMLVQWVVTYSDA